MHQSVHHTVECLKAKGLILFPTDTIWGLGGDATAQEVVSSVYSLKNRIYSKALLCLMKDIDMVRDFFAEVPLSALKLFEEERPTTVILDKPRGIAKNMIAADDSLAVRIPKDDFCQALLTAFGKPIIATSANTSGHPSPQCFSEIENSILEGVDYIVPLKKDLNMTQPSRIVKVDKSGDLTVIRS